MRLVTVLVQELAAAQTEHWDELSYRASVVADRTQAHVSLVGGWPPGRAQEPTSPAFQEALAKLRSATAPAGLGAWFTISLTVRADGEVGVSYDFDTEPWFLPPPGPEDYARDFERFPRSVEAQPSWLRERLSWARLTPEQTVRANRGAYALRPYPPAPGGQRHMFTVTVTPEDDVEVYDHASGGRAFVDRHGAVRLADPDRPIRPD